MSNAWDDAAQALRDSCLYVHPDAEAELEDAGIPFTDAEQADALEQLRDASTPIWVAVLPAAAGANPSLAAFPRAVGSDGTYIAVLPNLSVNADSTLLDGVQPTVVSASRISNDLPEFIENAISGVEGLAETQTDGQGGGTGPRGGGGGILPLAILLAAGGGGFLLYRRNKLNRERAELEQVRGVLDEDITAYGERLSALDLDVREDSKVPIEARREYGRALDLYENAKLYADRAEKPADLKPVTHALEEGRWLLGCVGARMSGEPLPERRMPCFFDPSHGPSVEDVQWAPQGGVPRGVPACAADAYRVKQGLDPESRLVTTADGERRPYWDAGPAYGAWAAGYYGAVLPAMMVGTMLGTTMAAPLAYGAGAGDAAGGGDFGGGFEGGGGDFGGGFEGGGDFGGGFDF
ncbi:hypothetical protein G1H11_07580 [Phytoactinopolyspora alkaliphila]|uniref:Uncharacterized protein n=1 Tax=Phytoactinopolyspora alkaliphila TaxID=1783498 RepID=A0A6N9YJN6_9ACTN|nr:hypothetical protein [Phytoactinopolyspora alkaliphila]NED95174.1 hypothetical protein [Phytoactinopolyspora alkaliphila]